jgi:hypothetical protein
MRLAVYNLGQNMDPESRHPIALGDANDRLTIAWRRLRERDGGSPRISLTIFKNRIIAAWRKSLKTLQQSRESSIAIDASTALILTAAFLYIAGWSYIYHYLGHFGVPISSLEYSLYAVLVYSSNIILTRNGMMWWLCVLVGAYLIRRVLPSTTTLFFAGVAMMVGALRLGWQEGVRSAEYIRSIDEGRRITFVFKDTSHIAPDLLARSTDWNLRPLTQTKDRYIVLFQPPEKSGVMPRAIVYQIPMESLIMSAIRIPDIARRSK